MIMRDLVWIGCASDDKFYVIWYSGLSDGEIIEFRIIYAAIR